ncbi:hypothetical protein [Exiguobacterium artemiae]|uniref:hypothetical protein n=1 Tax=Exiguobacterium artemiae TaxID=340145 RepID=UPI003D0793D4
MNKHYLLGTLAVAIGIVMLFVIKLFAAYMDLTRQISEQQIASFGLIYYPMAFFIIGIAFFITAWWQQDLKKQQETVGQPIKSS